MNSHDEGMISWKRIRELGLNDKEALSIKLHDFYHIIHSKNGRKFVIYEKSGHPFCGVNDALEAIMANSGLHR